MKAVKIIFELADGIGIRKTRHKRYAGELGIIPNLVSSKQNIIMISSSLLDILQELMPKLSRKSCVVHSMAIRKTTMCLQ